MTGVLVQTFANTGDFLSVIAGVRRAMPLDDRPTPLYDPV